MQQEASILIPISRDPNANAGHKLIGVQVDGNRAHALIPVLLTCQVSRIVACEELALGLEFIEFDIGWGRRDQGNKSARRPIKRAIRRLLKNMLANGKLRDSGFVEV